MLAGKVITIGVTGGIAAYKAADLVSLLSKNGAEVHVVMTGSAREFIQPLTFETLSGRPVVTDLFNFSEPGRIPHIDLAARSQLLVVVPATANIIAKAACAIADDLLSTILLAATCPVLFCPAMNTNMYTNRGVQRNINLLKELGYLFVEPGFGRLACGALGQGRLADLDIIYEEIIKSLWYEKDLTGTKVMVTAGATREAIDPVRFITNRSSGKMGYALARAARDRGAEVILVSGISELKTPHGVKVLFVESARDMHAAVLSHFPEVDVVIKAAAVADYRPKITAEHKIKKSAGVLSLELERNPDILLELGQLKKKGQILVGFAAESRDLLRNAKEKIQKKNLDLLVANDITQPEAGFGVDTNIVKFVYPDKEAVELPKLDKLELAHRILDEIIKIR
ncbi:bifunctional phosphopantothenoylcysteine decarboxylase/phosphopantothenate--cysteine ligase CoaBC [Desulfolucanica intricata]|uniref:bifunctional phosphopantothenoylcysteine decarboxylase/phosphopantothenate--cysteine ligase CoaBC n=1 Tax=Desulfolucanica intricata TaxID=1285191 RepID=UPI00083095D9|nr:bifunctional phosphopantothenoylcysteine decarboxylase/phosphopantothenate--cysteine ligase CoaBC [Desulfolucanica intricata]